MKVPDVKRCCCCLPLRPGIILFAYINLILSVILVTCLMISTELQRASMPQDDKLEMMTSTVLYGLLGMGVILNVLLIVSGYQRDISMMRLYNYYAVAIMLSMLVVHPIVILISREMFVEIFIGFLFMAMQCYLIMLVRSEVVKLEINKLKSIEEIHEEVEEQVDVSDNITLV